MNFRTQAERFLKAAQARKRNPISEASARKYEASLEHAFTLFANLELSEVNNNALKVLVNRLSTEGLSASTINGVVTVVKLVVASAVGQDGEPLFPRTWNHEFIDLPVIDPKSQKAPVMGAQAISRAIRDAGGQDKALCALIAGSGLRIAEAQALYVGPEDSVKSTWDPQAATIFVKSTVVGKEIQDHAKTDAGTREIDLAPELNAFLIEVLKPVVGERMFKSQTGGLLRVHTAAEHLSTVPGFHSLRRFRITYLENNNVPRALIKFWSGHAKTDISERYMKFGSDIAARKDWAVKIGVGFELQKQA